MESFPKRYDPNTERLEIEKFFEKRRPASGLRRILIRTFATHPPYCASGKRCGSTKFASLNRFEILPDCQNMSFFLNINRRWRWTVALALLPIVLSIHVGCRTFSSKPSSPLLTPAAEPQFSPNVTVSSQPPASLFGGPSIHATPVEESLPERAEAFRPIVPDHLITEIVTPKTESQVVPSNSVIHSVPLSKEPIREPAPAIPPDTSKTQIEQLNRRIEQLERALAESETKAIQQENRFNRPLPDSPQRLMEQSAQQSTPQPTVTEVAKPTTLPKPIPTFNIDGVATASEGDGFRIEISDRVLFITGTWQLNPEFEESLRKIVGEIRANNPEASLDIEGHTDSLVVDPVNATQKHDVSSMKSMVVMQYFIKALQWSPERIKTSSHGPSRPVADNGTPEGRARNNRIEIVVLGSD